MSSRPVTQSYGCLIHLAGASSDRQARRQDRVTIGRRSALLSSGGLIRKKRVAHLRRFPQGLGFGWGVREDQRQAPLSLRAVDHEGEVLETVVTAKRFCL